MKTYLMLATCLFLAGCGRQEQNQREVISKLNAITSELSKSVAPVRWATANKSEITTFIYKCSRDKVEQIKMSDALPPETEAKFSEYEALSKRVTEAKTPIAAIVDRRERQAAQYREQFSIERLIAEYGKDRFDLVVDSSDERFSRSAVLYRKAGEGVDITEGIIALMKAKANQ